MIYPSISKKQLKSIIQIENVLEASIIITILLTLIIMVIIKLATMLMVIIIMLSLRITIIEITLVTELIIIILIISVKNQIKETKTAVLQQIGQEERLQSIHNKISMN